MNISLNALLLSHTASYRSAGISQYIFELLRNLRSNSEHRFEVNLPQIPDDPELTATPMFRPRAVGARFSRPALRILWEQVMQPIHLARTRPDLVHALGYALPLGWSGRSVMTICDLSFIRFPALFNRSNALYLGTLCRVSAHRATQMITISESTRRDVIELLGVAPDRVTTTYCGVSDRFHPPVSAEVEAFRNRLGLPARFMLFVGTIEPRKNVPGLIRAYAQYRERTSEPVPLMLAGGRGWKDAEVFDLVSAMGLSESVHFPGYVPAQDLPLWYAAATAFVYPSRYEGFGLPVLEAMACGTPVITSDASSIPEVTGDAAILTRPDDERGIAEAMLTLMSDEARRSALSLAGQKRAAQFRWDTMAAETLQVYERCINR